MDLLKVSNPPYFSYCSLLVICVDLGIDRRRLSTVDRSEFVVQLHVCFWNASERGVRRAKVVDRGLKADASGCRYWGVLVPIPVCMRHFVTRHNRDRCGFRSRLFRRF